MELVMYIGNDFIASLPLVRAKIPEPGYISSLKRELLKKNADTLLYISVEPEFLVVNLSSSLYLQPSTLEGK